MSHENALSLCSVTSPDTQRAPFPNHTTTKALDVSPSTGNVLSNTRRNLAGTTLPRKKPHSNSYRVTTCSLQADIRVRSRPLLCTRCTTWDHNKHQACSSRTAPRDIDFSDVSSKTLLVLVLRCIFHPSHVHLLGGFIGLLTSSLPPAMAVDSLPDLCGRPPGQPQRCSAIDS